MSIAPLDRESRVQAQPLFIGGLKVGTWKLSMLVDLDWTRSHLKVTKSNFSLFADVDKTPLARYEFDDSMRTAPTAHWQFHAERGAFSTLLAAAKEAGRDVVPHSLSKLHFPVGGARMRPGVDDLLEFLIKEVGADPLPEWRAVIDADRERWRTIQAKTIARDMQSEVAEVLRNRGWTVTPPDDHEPAHGDKFLKRW